MRLRTAGGATGAISQRLSAGSRGSRTVRPGGVTSTSTSEHTHHLSAIPHSIEAGPTTTGVPPTDTGTAASAVWAGAGASPGAGGGRRGGRGGGLVVPEVVRAEPLRRGPHARGGRRHLGYRGPGGGVLSALRARDPHRH